MFNGNMKKLQIPVLTRFLNANRYPLRLKTLQIPVLTRFLNANRYPPRLKTLPESHSNRRKTNMTSYLAAPARRFTAVRDPQSLPAALADAMAKLEPSMARHRSGRVGAEGTNS